MVRRAVVPVVVAGCVSALLGADFWNKKPYGEWSRKEVLKILNDSPWAEEYVDTWQRGRSRSGGESEMYYSHIIRFFSALPVREAYVRMLQIMNRYDELGESERREFDQKFTAALRLDVSQRIIVAFEFRSNDRNAELAVNTLLKTATAESLKQNVYLISERAGRVQMEEYYAPSPDGTGAKFIFPRLVDGEPIVAEGDGDLSFEFTMPRGSGGVSSGFVPGAERSNRVFIRKKVNDLIYKGKIEI